MPDSNQLFKKDKEFAKKYLGPKALNRRQLIRQNLIFLVVAIIIMAGLAALVIFNLSFIVGKINQSFKIGSNGTHNITQFDLKSFQQIQDKLGIVLTIVTPTPTVAPISSEAATTTPIISITPSTSASPTVSPSATPTITASPSITATPTPTPKATVTPTPKSTVTPTFRPSVTSTPTPTPTQ
ncbi:MAG: hypothetical protein Q8N90_03695 [bacterium]|nr:hypothetical protein [bacterium]